MTSSNTAKFVRLILFSYDTSLNITRAFTDCNILPNYNNSITDFLEKHKHEIYHLWINDTKCCQGNCNLPHTKILTKDQFEKLYNISRLSTPGHYIKKLQYCNCGLVVDTTCTLDSLDVSLIVPLILNCCTVAQDETLWLETIRKIRNKLSHVESVSAFDEGRLQKWWDKLEGSVMGLVSKTRVYPGYKKMTQSQIDVLKSASFDVDQVKQALDLIKPDIAKLQDIIVEENLVTREVIIKKLTEHAEEVKGQVEHLKDDVIEAIRSTFELQIEIKELIFTIVTKGFDKYIKDLKRTDDLQSENKPNDATKDDLRFRTDDKQTEISGKPCRVEWKLETPDSWKVEQITKTLNGVTDMLKNWFNVEFVYVGSLVIISSVSSHLLEDFDALTVAIRSFLEFLVTVCSLDTDSAEIINVELSIIEEQRNSIVYTQYSENKVDNKTEKDQDRHPGINKTDPLPLKNPDVKTLIEQSKYCPKHPQTLGFKFCTSHDAVICDTCYGESHMVCDSVIRINEASKRVKTSSALVDIKERITGLCQHYDRVLKLGTETNKNLRNEVKLIKQDTLGMDYLHGDVVKTIIDKLNKTFKLCLNSNQEIIADLRSKQFVLESWMECLSSSERHKSETEMFMVMKAINSKVYSFESNTNASFKHIKFNYVPYKDLLTIREKLDSIGKPEVIEIPGPIWSFLNQAMKPTSNKNLKPIFHHSFQTSVLRVRVSRGCFLPNKKMLLRAVGGNGLFVFDINNSEIRSINPGTCSFSFAVNLVDQHRAIVTVGNKGYRILDLETLTLGKCIRPGNKFGCYAVSCCNGRNLVGTDSRKVLDIDIDGNIKQEYKTKDICCLHQWNDGSFFYSCYNDNHVYYVDNKSKQAKYHSCSDVPICITGDEERNLYITVKGSNNIERIEPDRMESEVILSDEDGISKPMHISYNTNTRQLLIINNSGQSLDIYDL